MFIRAKGIVADKVTLNAGGADALVLEYRFNASLHWQEVMKLRLELAQMAEKKHPNTEQIGSKIIELFGVVFGADTTKEIVSFFENSYESMIENLLPVFQYKIYPACEKARKRAIKARKAAK